MQPLPSIPGTKTALNADIALSILLDRALLVEIGRNVIVVLSAEETRLLLDYLRQHSAKFVIRKGGTQP